MPKNKTKTNLWMYLQDRMFETTINLEKGCSSSPGLADCIIPEQCFSKLPHLELRNMHSQGWESGNWSQGLVHAEQVCYHGTLRIASRPSDATHGKGRPGEL